MLVQDLSSNGSMRLNSYLDFGRWTVNSVPWPTVPSAFGAVQFSVQGAVPLSRQFLHHARHEDVRGRT